MAKRTPTKRAAEQRVEPMVRIGLYPGTFDPVTNGHMDIIERAAKLFDRLLVGVAVNAGKGPLFSVEQRIEMLAEEVRAIADRVLAARIAAVPIDGLLVDCAREHRATVIVRGLRGVADFEYEYQMASINSRLNGVVETVFLMSSDRHQSISSRFVKEIGALGGDVSHFVSPRVTARIQARFAGGRDKALAGAASKVY
jgi:pantetheine-phosphate adenylyltransferase